MGNDYLLIRLYPGSGPNTRGRRLPATRNAESSVPIWDLAGMVNRPLPAGAKPSALGSSRPACRRFRSASDKAYNAIWRFAVAPEQALPFLASTLQPAIVAQPPDGDRV